RFSPAFIIPPYHYFRSTTRSTTQKTTALCYIRQSFTRDGSDMNSPERQRANIQVICDRNGWKPEWYQDADGHRSGRTEKNRPGWLALKVRLSDPDVVALVANDTSRLHRKSWRIGDLLDFLQENNIRLVLAASNQEIDLSGISGMLFAQLVAIFDEWYAADISRRQKDSIAYRKKLGKGIGIPPFGTERNEDGFLCLTEQGAWWLPDGTYVGGVPNKRSDDGALWRSYADSALRVLTLYSDNRFGSEIIAYKCNIEGWPFRDRSGTPRAMTKDDIRRIVRNWPEYGGLIMDKNSKDRHPHEFNLSEIRLNAEKAVFPLDLLNKVAKIYIERGRAPRNHGVKKDASIYALNGITYCAHCIATAAQQSRPELRTRLQGSRRRYNHKEGVYCTCTSRSVPCEDYEQDFGRLVKLLTIRPEALTVMTDLAISASRLSSVNQLDTDPETEKREAIALCQRRIDAALHLYGDGRISRDEYLRRMEQNEREIAYWESHTTESEKASLELAMCMDALNKLAELWDSGNEEDRQGMARTLFTRVVYNLDTRRIVDFTLKPWAERYLTLRAALYENEDDNNTGGGQGEMAAYEVATKPSGSTRVLSA
ncbi:MAG: recombinase family protein, partial [Anaerolineae bacterium]|nr:recombinase family protein [Anaerolineae bacterium]